MCKLLHASLAFQQKLNLLFILVGNLKQFLYSLTVGGGGGIL